MVSWLIFCSLIHGVSFPLVLGLFGIHKVWLEHLLTNKSHIFPATCRFIEWFCWQYFRMFNSNGLKCLKCELSTNKSRWQRGMDMQRCLGKIFLKLQQYRHGLSAEVVAALLKAGADIGLVDKSVKDCCQDWYAKAATGQLILTPIDIITDYTKLLHFFLCVCVRVCERSSLTSVSRTRRLLQLSMPRDGRILRSMLWSATTKQKLARWPWSCYVLLLHRWQPHRLAWKIDHQPWRNPQTFTGQKMSNMWTVRHRPQQI